MDPQKLRKKRVPGTYLSVMISKDVWDHVLVPCLTFKFVYRYSNYYHDFELYSTWIENGKVIPLQHIPTCNKEGDAICNKILDYK